MSAKSEAMELHHLHHEVLLISLFSSVSLHKLIFFKSDISIPVLFEEWITKVRAQLQRIR